MLRLRCNHGASRSRAAAWLVVAAVLLPGLIPAGYMVNPEAGASGASLLVLCPEGLGESVRGHLAGSHALPSGHGVHEAPCIYSAVLALALTLAALGRCHALWVALGAWPLPRPDFVPPSTSDGARRTRAPPLSA